MYAALDLALPCTFALFIWWFGTGAILYLDGLARATFRSSLVISAALALASLVCIGRVAERLTVVDAYVAFTCTIFVWAFIELSFLTGLITGPNKSALPQGQVGLKRFANAVNALIYHELAILFVGALIIYLSWGKTNQVASGTFLVLWIMRTSAKLNLFLGVRNLGIEYLPIHLKYLQSFFRQRRLNWLFPLSVTASTAVIVAMVSSATKAEPAAMVGTMLMATLLALAVLEHWFMVIPISTQALWQWAMPKSLQPATVKAH